MGGNRVGQGRALARFSVQQLPNGSSLVSQGFLCAVFAVYCFAVNLKPCKRLWKERLESCSEAGKGSEMGMWWEAVGRPGGRNPLGYFREQCPVLPHWHQCSKPGWCAQKEQPRKTWTHVPQEGLHSWTTANGSIIFPHYIALQTKLSSNGSNRD